MKILRIMGTILLCIIVCINCTSCSVFKYIYETPERQYYAESDNFVPIEVEFKELIVNEIYPDEYIIRVDLKNSNDDKVGEERFIREYFKANKTNSAILRQAGIEEKLTCGTEFTIVSAPAYFGDGYDYPITALEINGEVLLDFDTGYKNLMVAYNF